MEDSIKWASFLRADILLSSLSSNMPRAPQTPSKPAHASSQPYPSPKKGALGFLCDGDPLLKGMTVEQARQNVNQRIKECLLTLAGPPPRDIQPCGKSVDHPTTELKVCLGDRSYLDIGRWFTHVSHQFIIYTEIDMFLVSSTSSMCSSKPLSHHSHSRRSSFQPPNLDHSFVSTRGVIEALSAIYSVDYCKIPILCGSSRSTLQLSC